MPNPYDLSGYRDARILITGGAGLIGSNMARRLADLGAQVTILDSLIPEFGGNLFNVADLEGRIRVNISDLRDLRALQVLVQGQDFIFNLAAQTSHADSMTAPLEDLAINCQAQLALLEVCRTVNSSTSIVFASTRQIYGRPRYLPVDEKHPLEPVDINGIHKVSGESYHLLYHELYDLKTVVLRLTNVFGPGMRIKDARQMFLGIWIKRILEGQPFEIWGGDQVRDFTYVEDVVDAFLVAALSPRIAGRAWNVGGTEPLTLLSLADLLVQANDGQGSFVRKSFPPERKRIDIGNFYTDDGAFRSISGWAPRATIHDALRRTVDFYRTNLQHYL